MNIENMTPIFYCLHILIGLSLAQELHPPLRDQYGLRWLGNSIASLDKPAVFQEGLEQLASVVIVDKNDMAQKLRIALDSNQYSNQNCTNHLNKYKEALIGSLQGKSTPFWAIKSKQNQNQK